MPRAPALGEGIERPKAVNLRARQSRLSHTGLGRWQSPVAPHREIRAEPCSALPQLPRLPPEYEPQADAKGRLTRFGDDSRSSPEEIFNRSVRAVPVAPSSDDRNDHDGVSARNTAPASKGVPPARRIWMRPVCGSNRAWKLRLPAFPRKDADPRTSDTAPNHTP